MKGAQEGKATYKGEWLAVFELGVRIRTDWDDTWSITTRGSWGTEMEGERGTIRLSECRSIVGSTRSSPWLIVSQKERAFWEALFPYWPISGHQRTDLPKLTMAWARGTAARSRVQRALARGYSIFSKFKRMSTV
jgi:hypothetical protein